MKNASAYAHIIMNDETEKFVSETPVTYNDERIERVYEFHDGAVVKYEWQSALDGRTSPDGKYNHRFTLVRPPANNPRKFEPGEIFVINYPTS